MDDADLSLSEPTRRAKAWLDALPGAQAQPMAAPRGRTPIVMIYKLVGRTFAILGLRGDAFVILKCDPHLVEVLRDQYAGVGHRSHLDRRHWISVSLDADVPPDEIERLVASSYALVRAGLTRRQKAELEAEASPGPP